MTYSISKAHIYIILYYYNTYTKMFVGSHKGKFNNNNYY